MAANLRKTMDKLKKDPKHKLKLGQIAKLRNKLNSALSNRLNTPAMRAMVANSMGRGAGSV